MVPILENSSGVMKEILMPIPVVDIHALVDYLYTNLKLQCPAERTREYWHHLRAQNNPFAKNFPGTDEHIPFSLYGDECCLGNDPKDKVTGIFLSFTLFKPRSVREGQFLICAVQDSVLIHENMRSLRPILKHIVWSCNCAFEGRYPSSDADGKPLPASKQNLAGKVFESNRLFSCVELRGDWKWHERVMRLLSTPTSIRCCFLCNAHARDGHLRYYNHDEAAGWVHTEYTTLDFLTCNVLRPGLLRLLPLSKCNMLLLSLTLKPS